MLNPFIGEIHSTPITKCNQKSHFGFNEFLVNSPDNTVFNSTRSNSFETQYELIQNNHLLNLRTMSLQ